MFLQRCLVQIPLLVAASARTEILGAPEKDFVVSKNANVSEEKAFFPEHNSVNPIFLACLIPLLRKFLNEQGMPLFLNLFLSDGRKSERELGRGEGGRVERFSNAAL